MLTCKTVKIKSNNLGAESLVPDLKGGGSVPHFKYRNGFEPSKLKGFNEGMLDSVLPYTLQNGFDRDFKYRDYKAVVLENEYLEAVFLPELGGRLWSLYDKKRKTHLVYENDVLCFSNLALRKAWFAGGVEWNLGIRGHSVFTCDKLFTVFEKSKDGRDVLKMYEYEVIRGLVYVMRFTLIEDKLVCKFDVENVSGKDTYMYWWSNIALEMTENTRIIVPTDKTYLAYYSEGVHILSYENVPNINGVDYSYANNSQVTSDFFYDIPSSSKKWICGVENNNTGLLQYASRSTVGKKLFVWGHTQGGEHWNEWLTYGRDYLEIQSGLLETQFQHSILKKGESITFFEVYTGITLTENNYDGKYLNLVKEIDNSVDENYLNDCYFENLVEEKTVCFGSGRGALYELSSNKKLTDKCEFYKESIGEKEKYYYDLINDCVTDKKYSISYTNCKELYRLMKDKKVKYDIDNYLLGVTALIFKEYDIAEISLKNVKKGDYYSLALISLALYFYWVKKDNEQAYKYAENAVNNSSDRNILAAYSEIAASVGKHKEMINVISNSEFKNFGRMKMYLIKGYTALDMLKEAEEIVKGELVIPDMREGEYSLYSVYLELYKKIIAKEKGVVNVEKEEVDRLYPIKKELDFRLD